jgi:hypothetical protein
VSLEVRVSGVDITDDVMIEDARFTMANGPNPGDFEFRVRDNDKTYDFHGGQPIDVDFDSVRIFEGYVLIASAGHGFAVDDSVTAGPGPVERIWTLKGVDLNILFRKRFVFDQADPSNPVSLDLAAGTSDLTYLNAIVDHLTLGGDNLTFDFNAVGSPNPDKDGIAISVGDSWERVMALTAALPGGIWGIRPPRTVYYEDNDTETAPFAISDVPDGVTSFGYANFDWLNDGSRLCNDARIWGVGLGQDRLTYVNVTDAASIAEHGRWQNGNGWRYNLYAQDSVNLVANSLVYGSPQNLHGAKDDSIVVTCRIKRPGIMPGHKVRIISDVFGEEIVLPVRRYTITFVDRNQALFDLEMSWLIDAPYNMFDYPPFPEFPGFNIPDITVPNPCTDLITTVPLVELGVNWETVHNHPWLGSSSFAEGSMQFNAKKRYGQIYALLGQHGDGISGGHTYLHARYHWPVASRPQAYAIQIDFQVPYFTMVPGYHLAPFPEFSSGIWWGAQSNDVYPQIALDFNSARLVACSGGVCRVDGNTEVAPGTRIRWELLSNGHVRSWAWADGTRPTSPSNEASGGPTISTEPWYQEDYGPGRPWREVDEDGFSTISGDYIYLRGTVYGGVGYTAFGGALPEIVDGNPTATNNDIRTRFENFTTGPTVGGNTSGYHEALGEGVAVRIPINSFRLVVLPDNFNFATDVPVWCDDIAPAPVSGSPGATNCESLEKTTDSTYTTTWAFIEGSSVVTLEGVELRRGIDYNEDVVSHQIVFPEPVLSSAKLYVCYKVVA